jgi:uncharacterized protein with NRDE domain
MCLILIAWRGHTEFPCVIAANRDEYHARPAVPAQWWGGDPEILGGRDLQAGGTWLGVTRTGRFAALTNYRDPEQRRETAPSRGALVPLLLRSNTTTSQMLEYLRDIGDAYNGFNVIFSDGSNLAVYESVRGAGRELGAGIYGLSNHLLDTPWPKVQNAKSRLSEALAQMPQTPATLELLRDSRPAPDEELPRTGVSLEWERLLSSAFVRAGDYGTRCSTIVRIDRSGQGYFDEGTWDPQGAAAGSASFRFMQTRR